MAGGVKADTHDVLAALHATIASEVLIIFMLRINGSIEEWVKRAVFLCKKIDAPSLQKDINHNRWQNSDKICIDIRQETAIVLSPSAICNRRPNCRYVLFVGEIMTSSSDYNSILPKPTEFHFEDCTLGIIIRLAY